MAQEKKEIANVNVFALIENGKTQEAITWIKKNPKCINCKKPGEWTVLMEAAMNGNAEIVKLLINTPLVGRKDEDSFTALMFAAGQGHEKCVAILSKTRELGMDRGKIGETALTIAALNGETKCVKILAKTKEIGMRTSDGSTALMLAAIEGYHDCVRILVNTKEIGMKNKYDKTALQQVLKLRENGNSDNNIKKCIEILNNH